MPGLPKHSDILHGGVLLLKQAGYENVANMAGGIVDWERDGLPLTTDITARLSGSCMCQLKPRENRNNKP